MKTDDFHDIMNAQFYVLTRVFKQLELQTDSFKITSVSPWEAIIMQGDHNYAGWSAEFTATVPLGDYTAC